MSLMSNGMFLNNKYTRRIKISEIVFWNVVGFFFALFLSLTIEAILTGRSDFSSDITEPRMNAPRFLILFSLFVILILSLVNIYKSKVFKLNKYIKYLGVS